MAESALPTEGRTVKAHVLQLLTEADQALGTVWTDIQGRRMRPADRERLRRDLAGVISRCETARIWLDAGAPT